MNDRDTLIAMLDRADIEFEKDDEETIVVEGGYVGFSSWFTFDEDGKLKTVKAYE